jgi:hypothetical protein
MDITLNYTHEDTSNILTTSQYLYMNANQLMRTVIKSIALGCGGAKAENEVEIANEVCFCGINTVKMLHLTHQLRRTELCKQADIDNGLQDEGNMCEAEPKFESLIPSLSPFPHSPLFTLSSLHSPISYPYQRSTRDHHLVNPYAI